MTNEHKKALINYLFDFISDQRKKRFLDIIEYRTRHVTVVLEDIFQAQNASAVLRTCDCFGIQDVHAIETKNKFDVNRDIALGSTQWLNLYKHKGEGNNTIKCLNTLKDKGYKIIATSPYKNGHTIEELPLDNKTALVFGTELEGITDDVKNMADGFVTVPMFGFTESFNISVSAALALYTLTNRLHKSEIKWQLTDEEKDDILLKWQRNTINKVELIEKEFLERMNRQ